jgi:serine/threonine protein phosphatase PrpC
MASATMPRGTALALRAAGATDVGRQRDVNEDRFHIDRDRGVFIVVDGVGGQAAGGRAADVALEMVRARLARETGAVADRIRDAITIANNEVHRAAASRPEWRGMACVLTVAVITGERVAIGHVGDTRLYKLRGGTMKKITPDHSPVGEREDSGELSEADAMRHPRRNEVYRDVGSDLHEPNDPEFADVREVEWEPDAALLLCSDGLTDLVPSDAIKAIVARFAGQPDKVARALVDAANEAGGKDNITVVYVENDRFTAPKIAAQRSAGRGRSGARMTVLTLLLATLMAAGAWWYAGYPLPPMVTNAISVAAGNAIIVRNGETISAAIERASAGATILVEPGEYRERLTLKSDVRIVSMTPRGATLRLPNSATDQDAAVMAESVSNAHLQGFRIVGDAATPLGTGIVTRGASVSLIDLEVTGAARTAVDLGPGGGVQLLASEIHDNPGTGLALRADATPRVAYNTFSRNGASAQAASAVVIELGAKPVLQRNTFYGFDPQTIGLLDDAVRSQLRMHNVFPDARPLLPAPGRGGRGRGASQ